MLIQDLNTLWRKQVSDEEQPFLWDDVEFLQYLIDAQDTFVRITGGFSDNSTTALTDVALVANTPTSSFSPYILRIRSGKLVTAKRDVPIISEADMRNKQVKDYGLILSDYQLDDADTGDVVAAIIGLEDLKLRWWKVPDTADTFRMHIYRLPYPRITKQEDTLEIPEQHHLALLQWVKYHAYNKEDAETYDKTLSEKNHSSFMRYCEKAKEELERQRYKPRVVHYRDF